MDRSSPHKVYYLYSGFTSFLFSMTFAANLVYQVDTAHLNALQLVLVGTALEGSVFLFEIPTGVVADLYSRRLSVIIGVFLVSVGFIYIPLTKKTNLS